MIVDMEVLTRVSRASDVSGESAVMWVEADGGWKGEELVEVCRSCCGSLEARRSLAAEKLGVNIGLWRALEEKEQRRARKSHSH